jgi:transposase
MQAFAAIICYNCSMKKDLENPLLLKKVIQDQGVIIVNLNKRFAAINKKLADKVAELAGVYERYYLLQHKRFGKSTEADPGQLNLFNELEVLIEEIEHTKADIDTPISKRKQPTRKPLPKELPRETIIHDIPAQDKQCTDCGNELHKMGEDKSEKLEFIPASVKVVEHIRPKYSCRHCEQCSTGVSIIQAAVPASPFPKSFATASLLSHIIVSKYQYSLPLYRQEDIFKAYGIELSRQTMSGWMMKSSQLLTPLYNRLHHILLQQNIIQADETPLRVIESDKSKCYMWLYCTGADSPENYNSDIPNIVLYDFNDSRSGSCAVNFLQGYEGYLQVDGYQGYGATDATLVGCMAHARRKFKEAQLAGAKEGYAVWAMTQIKKLYKIEALIKDMSPADKHAYRQKHAKPLLVQYKAWLDNSIEQVLPKSALGTAMAYSLNQWPKLIRYIEDGNLNIDNNRSERAVKPFVIGRKNWLFSNTLKGATSSGVLYSIVQTAKANGLIPFVYLNYVLDELSKPSAQDNLDNLLPWNVNL